jgi:hypothetical protein
MDEDERRAFDRLRDIPDNIPDNMGDCPIDIDNVLDGSTRIDISHAGGEFQQMLEEDVRKEQWCSQPISDSTPCLCRLRC